MKRTFFLAILSTVSFLCEANHQLNYGGMDLVLTAQCLEKGGEEAVATAIVAKDNLSKCIVGYIRTAQQHDAMDAKIREFCKQERAVSNCVKDYFQQVSICYNEVDTSELYIMNNATRAALEYACYNSGERINEFMEEGGPECLIDHMKPVLECLTVSLGKVGMIRISKSHQENPEEPLCKEMDELKSCILELVGKCKSRKPADIMRGFMNAVRNVGPCVKYYDPNGAGNLTNPLVHAVMCSLAAILSRSLH